MRNILIDREIWGMYNIASVRTSWTAYFTRPLLYTSVWSWHVLAPFVPISHCLFSKSKSSVQTGWDLLVASPPELRFRKYINMENSHVSTVDLQRLLVISWPSDDVRWCSSYIAPRNKSSTSAAPPQSSSKLRVGKKKNIDHSWQELTAARGWSSCFILWPWLPWQ